MATLERMALRGSPDFMLGSFGDMADSIAGLSVDSHLESIKDSFKRMSGRVKEVGEENRRLKNSPPSQENIRTEKRFLALIDALKNAPPQQKKFAKKLLDADVALVDAWYKADTEDKRIRALAREEIQSQKP
jgi:hypothetical protein